MMNATRWSRAVALVVLVGVALALLAGTYEVGVAAGAASAGTAGAATAAWGGWAHGPGAFPWFFLWPVFFVLFILFIVWLVRAAVWGGGRRGGPWRYGPWDDPREGQTEERFEEWHRRAHQGSAQNSERSGGDHPSS
jgi:hypothetical protein